MRKIWLVLMGMFLCTPIYASTAFVMGHLIGSATSHNSNTAAAGSVSTEARVYSCYIPRDVIDYDKRVNALIGECAQRLQRICPTCVLGHLHSVAENFDGVNVNFEIVDTEEIKYGHHNDGDNFEGENEEHKK